MIISSGTLVLPRITAPAARRRRTTSASAARGRAVGVAAVRGDLAGDVDVVLDRDRDAEQRALVAAAAAAVGLVGLGERALGEHDAEGVERRVEARDALEVRARPARATRPRRRRSARPGGRAPAKARSVAVHAARTLPRAMRRRRAALAPIVEGLARSRPRAPCTDAERRAAAWLHDELRDPAQEAWVETLWVRPQCALAIALAALASARPCVAACWRPPHRCPGLVIAVDRHAVDARAAPAAAAPRDPARC